MILTFLIQWAQQGDYKSFILFSATLHLFIIYYFLPPGLRDSLPSWDWFPKIKLSGSDILVASTIHFPSSSVKPKGPEKPSQGLWFPFFLLSFLPPSPFFDTTPNYKVSRFWCPSLKFIYGALIYYRNLPCRDVLPVTYYLLFFFLLGLRIMIWLLVFFNCYIFYGSCLQQPNLLAISFHFFFFLQVIPSRLDFSKLLPAPNSSDIPPTQNIY